MAGISVVSKTSSSVTLCLSGLDTSWNGATRTVYWYLGIRGTPTESTHAFKGTTTISGSPSSGGEITFSGLDANTKYFIACMVYHGSNLLAEKTGEVTTDYASGGGGVDSPWTAYFQDVINMTEWASSGADVDIILEEDSLYIFPVYFAQSGYAHFYTESNIDTRGYLSDSAKCNDKSSEPLSILNEPDKDDDLGSGSNFDIKYYVTAGKTYYIFVRGYSGEETGSVTLYVTQPWELDFMSYGTSYGTKTESIYVERPYTLYCRSVYFSKSGTITISASGGRILRGWLGTDAGWDYGQPTSYISPVSASGGWSDFSHSYNVVAGQAYYVWVADYSITEVGSTLTLNIDSGEEENTVSKWSWSASNGSASASQTSAAYDAIRYKQDTKNFNHKVWNDLVSKVGDILDAKGLSWDATYATYNNTKATLNANGEYELTAKMFNSLRNNLELAGYGYLGLSKIPDTTDHDEPPSGKIPHPVKSNKRVFGHYFTTLATYINSCIDKL